MIWKPSNEPGHYDRPRVEQTHAIGIEIDKLRLPLVRRRKLHSILNALVVQIEDGGDSPEVNHLLLEALEAAVRHQVGEKRASATLQAIDTFEQVEAKRWEMVKAGTLPPIELRPEERLDDLMQEGYRLLDAGQRTTACDKWLETWGMIKKLAAPDMRTSMDFDAAYPMTQSVFNWSGDLEMALDNAGVKDPVYYEHRARYAREFLVQFPDEDTNRQVMFGRAEGEALWRLGRQAEAEAVYQALVNNYPDKGWAYIGWSDEYYLWHEDEKDYESGEAILLRALARLSLEDRVDVLNRLTRLYEKWGKPDKQEAVAAQLLEIAPEQPQGQTFQVLTSKPSPRPSPSPSRSQSKHGKRNKRKRRH
jgi:tetratricopeptide (TPR) repeat protein